MSLTAHCLVKNEESFVGYAIKSVIDFVDTLIVFDTGSTDKTVEIIKSLEREYPDKIIFEEKGPCDKVRHTQLRQEMLDRTKTDWFMILDGDEIWTKRGIEEALRKMRENNSIGCILTPYFLCAGDIFHHSLRGKYVYDGIKIHALARIFRITPEVKWNLGPYGEDDYVKDSGGNLIRKGNYVYMKNKYWHASALVRSSKDSDVNLGRHKHVMSYSLKIIGVGFKIYEEVPEVFGDAQKMKLPLFNSWINAILHVLYGLKIIRKRLWI
jgi:glycosyltransferase involved in cell wall biosynthesis